MNRYIHVIYNDFIKTLTGVSFILFQLKIYTAGVWHNLVLAVIALALMFSFPILMSPFYNRNEGVAILSLRNSTVTDGPNGLRSGDIITSIGKCPVKNVTNYYSCLKEESKELSSYCVHSNDFYNLCSECCQPNSDKSNGSYLNFQTNDKNSILCLPVRNVINQERKYCERDSDCFNNDKASNSSNCVTPSVNYPSETLWVMSRRDRKEFLFIGTVSDLYYGIESVTDYVPKYDHIPLPISFPTYFEKICYYTASFSLALALINIVPCMMLDGQHVVNALVGLVQGNSELPKSHISRCLINFGSILLLLNIVLTFALMKWA